MAEKKQKKNWEGLIRQTEGGKKIGSFQESTGGGTPMRKGEKIDYVADNPQEAETYKKDNPGAIVRVQQPRDDNGQFTYNSANRRPLKYGPSRGETVPPFLLGVRLTFAKKSGKGALVTEEGKKYALPDDIRSEEEFINTYKDVKNWLSGDAKGKGGRTGKVTEFDEDYMRDKYVSNKEKYGGKKHRYAKKTEGSDTKQTPNTPKTESTPNDGVDYSQAKTDPQGFVKANRDTIKDLVKMADEKGVNLNVKDMVDGIANGSIKSFDDIRKALEGNE